MKKDKVNIISEIEDNSNRGSFFAHLLLNNTKPELLKEIASTIKTPESKVEIELKINGKQLFVKDFNEILMEWYFQVEAKNKEKYERLATEEGLLAKAQEMVRNRLGFIDNYLDSLKQHCEEKMEDWGNYE